MPPNNDRNLRWRGKNEEHRRRSAEAERRRLAEESAADAAEKRRDPARLQERERRRKRKILMSVAWTTSLVFFMLTVTTLIAMFLLYYFIPATINATVIDIGPPRRIEGALRPNLRLSQSKILFENQVFGPESMVLNPKTGLLYTGLKTGLIMEIDLAKKSIKRAVKLMRSKSDTCDGSYQKAHVCGRPLGLRFDDRGVLYVADAYFGMHSIDFSNEKDSPVIAAGEMISNNHSAPPVRYLNDFDFLPDGRMVIAESSTKFDDRDFLFDLFEHRPNGRLLVYDHKKKHLRILVDQLYFPNGVQVSPEKGSTGDTVRVFVAEMGMARIITVWAPTDHYSTHPVKTGVLVDRLPGYPDNIRLNAAGNLMVPLPAMRIPYGSSLERYPQLREFVTKLLSPQSLEMMAHFVTQANAFIVVVDTETGEIIDSLHDITSKVTSVSIAIDDGQGHLLMGSEANYYIARSKY